MTLAAKVGRVVTCVNTSESPLMRYWTKQHAPNALQLPFNEWKCFTNTLCHGFSSSCFQPGPPIYRLNCIPASFCNAKGWDLVWVTPLPPYVQVFRMWKSVLSYLIFQCLDLAWRNVGLNSLSCAKTALKRSVQLKLLLVVLCVWLCCLKGFWVSGCGQTLSLPPSRTC